MIWRRARRQKCCTSRNLWGVQLSSEREFLRWVAAGHGDVSNRSKPTLVQGLWAEGIISIAAGEYFSAAVGLSGRVFTWGRNKYGQLGHGGFANAFLPQPAPGITNAVQVQPLTKTRVDLGSQSRAGSMAVSSVRQKRAVLLSERIRRFLLCKHFY